MQASPRHAASEEEGSPLPNTSAFSVLSNVLTLYFIFACTIAWRVFYCLKRGLYVLILYCESRDICL